MNRPEICPVGEHDEVCHCGDPMEGHGFSNHGPVSMGCSACMRTQDELVAQLLAERKPKERELFGVNWQAIDAAVGNPVQPVHPGEILQDWMEENQLSQIQFCAKTGISRAQLSRFIRRKGPIRANAAVRIEAITNVSAEVWLHLQMGWDIAQERNKLRS